MTLCTGQPDSSALESRRRLPRSPARPQRSGLGRPAGAWRRGDGARCPGWPPATRRSSTVIEWSSAGPAEVVEPAHDAPGRRAATWRDRCRVRRRASRREPRSHSRGSSARPTGGSPRSIPAPRDQHRAVGEQRRGVRESWGEEGGGEFPPGAARVIQLGAGQHPELESAGDQDLAVAEQRRGLQVPGIVEPADAMPVAARERRRSADQRRGHQPESDRPRAHQGASLNGRIVRRRTA